jgi:hypothetical protein
VSRAFGLIYEEQQLRRISSRGRLDYVIAPITMNIATGNLRNVLCTKHERPEGFVKGQKGRAWAARLASAGRHQVQVQVQAQAQTALDRQECLEMHRNSIYCVVG